MVTVQSPEPLQAPVQPLKLWPLSGVALSVTCVPSVKKAGQVAAWQSMPAGVDLTVPCPVIATVSLCALAGVEKVAATVWFAASARAQEAEPVQSPLQPENVAAPGAVAVSVTGVLGAKFA